MATDPRQLILIVAKAIESSFTSSEWTELAYLTKTEEYVNGHPRLLRSLQWSDSDYKGHVIGAVSHILRKEPGNLKIVTAYPTVRSWLEEHDKDGLQRLRNAVGDLSPEFPRLSTSEVARDALADAQTLLTTRGPGSAIDRVHTGLHGFLKSACEEGGMSFARDATLTQLVKLLLSNDPSLSDLGNQTDEIHKMLRTSFAILDALDTIRNNASRAHANESLLYDEALLAINLARSLLQYLDSKLYPLAF